MGRTRITLGLLTIALVASVAPLARADAPAACDWRSFGHDLAHSFMQRPGCSPIDAGSVRRLALKWAVHTADSVTASPAVVDGTLYVGDWSGTFYAVDAETGAVRHTYRVADDHAVAFGRIVSSASVVDLPTRGGATQRAIVFGGGATLVALDPDLHELATIDLDPRTPADRLADAADPPTVEIESSPAIVQHGRGPATVYVGMDVHNGPDVGRTGLVSLSLAQGPTGAWSFQPLWKFDAEARQTYTGAAGLTANSGTGLGCGGVWSSPAVDRAAGLVVFGSGSCSYPEQTPAGWASAETMYALDAATGALRWFHQPATSPEEAHLDDDFGASPNLYRVGGTLVAGEGRKDASYHARDAASGAERFTAQVGTPGNLTDDFAVGGFLGTTAVWSDDSGVARAVIGATAIPFPTSPDQVDGATWAVRAIDPSDGHVLWVHRLAGPSYGHTTVVNGVALVPDTFTASVQALDAATGQLLWASPVGAPPASSVVPVGDSLYLGGGTRETDAEFKAVGTQLQNAFGPIGPHPLSPVSGIFAFHLLGG
jgi:polyvinyl alcohol dehydrogenase (cytochrome)